MIESRKSRIVRLRIYRAKQRKAFKDLQREWGTRGPILCCGPDKKQGPKYKGIITLGYLTGGTETKLVTATMLTRIGLLNPESTKTSWYIINGKLIKVLGFIPKLSKKKIKKVKRQLARKSLKLGKNDNMNCRERRHIRLNRKSRWRNVA